MKYFSYNISFLIFILLGNGFLSNIIREYSILFQLKLNHSKAIFYKSVPFFVSFILTIALLYLLNDKILAFFLGKFIGLFLFFIFIFFTEKINQYKYKFSWVKFNFFFKRVKYSSLIAILGWASGLGFLNFVKLYSKNEIELMVLGLILNLFVILQMVANGINQVYAPKLKIIYSNSKEKGMAYFKKTHFNYFILSIVLFFLIYIVVGWKDFFSFYFPNIESLFYDGNLYFIVIIFFISTFSWVSSPLFMILDLFKILFNINILFNIIAWLLIAVLFNLGFKNFIIYYIIIKFFVSFGTYLYSRLMILNFHKN